MMLAAVQPPPPGHRHWGGIQGALGGRGRGQRRLGVDIRCGHECLETVCGCPSRQLGGTVDTVAAWRDWMQNNVSSPSPPTCPSLEALVVPLEPEDESGPPFGVCDGPAGVRAAAVVAIVMSVAGTCPGEAATSGGCLEMAN